MGRDDFIYSNQTEFLKLILCDYMCLYIVHCLAHSRYLSLIPPHQKIKWLKDTVACLILLC